MSAGEPAERRKRVTWQLGGLGVNMSVVAEMERSGYHHNHGDKSHQEQSQSGSETVEHKSLPPSVQITPSACVQHSALPSFSEGDAGVPIPEYAFYQNHHFHQHSHHQQQSWCLPEAGVLFYPPHPLPQPQVQPPPQPPPLSLQTAPGAMAFYSQQEERTEPPQCVEGRITQRGRSKSSGSSTDAPWDIKDGVLPVVRCCVKATDFKRVYLATVMLSFGLTVYQLFPSAGFGVYFLTRFDISPVRSGLKPLSV